jgi:hypothetical protein
MGLDMYLEGEKYLSENYKEPEKNLTEDGFRVQSKILALGYWRKHPNLHGYIVNTFAGGVDECQEIDLGLEKIQQIIDAVNAGDLPQTEGFFFGKTDGTEKEEDLKILKGALAWLQTKEPNIYRSVKYRASW